MAKWRVSLNRLAKEAVLALEVEISVDSSEVHFTFSGPRREPATLGSAVEAMTWIDGYKRGLATERLIEQTPLC